MGYTKKTNPGASTTASIAGDQFNKILDIITGVTATDTTDEGNIKTPTRFGDNYFRIWHLGGSAFAYRFRSSTLTASQDVILPPLTAADTLVFLAHGATLLNKVVNVVDNSIIATGAIAGDLLVSDGTKYVRLPRGTAGQIPVVKADLTGLEWIDAPDPLAVSGGIALGGTAVFSGDASTKVFTIDHGLSDPPDIYFAIPVSTDAQGDPVVTVDINNITVTYPIAPPTGTNNISLVWGSGFSDVAVSSFSPTTTNTLQNKTISGANNTFSNIPMTALSGGHLIFDKISVPADQGDAEDILLYDKEIDANNNTLAAKMQIGAAIVEVSAF